MSHPTKEEVAGAVKLWRCNMAHFCHVSPCVHKEDVPSHCVPSCGEELPCLSSGLPSKCEIVGFRTPPRCGECQHWDSCDRNEWEIYCEKCQPGHQNYTPRQPGKGGAA